MRHFALLLLASSVSSCVRTTPSAETTLSRGRLLESRSQQQQQQHEPVNLRAAPAVVVNSPQTSPTLIRRGSHELRIQEHLALFRQAAAKTFRTWNGESRMKTDEGKELPMWSSVEKLESRKNEVLSRQGESKHREEEGSGEGSTTKKPIVQEITTPEISETTTQRSEQDQCKSCPTLFMDHNIDGRQLCANWNHVQDGFALTMASKYQTKDVMYGSSKCSRTVTCDEPYMLVK